MKSNEVKNKIIEELKKVIDPELGIDIVSLGMIEVEKIEDKKVYIKFLPTSPMCPLMSFLLEEIRSRILNLGYEPKINVDPFSWSPSRISRDLFEEEEKQSKGQTNTY